MFYVLFTYYAVQAGEVNEKFAIQVGKGTHIANSHIIWSYYIGTLSIAQ